MQLNNTGLLVYGDVEPSASGVRDLGQTDNGWAQLAIGERSSDPADPSEGVTVIWMSDGTGSGDDGDLMIKATAGGVTKTATIFDFSEAV